MMGLKIYKAAAVRAAPCLFDHPAPGTISFFSPETAKGIVFGQEHNSSLFYLQIKVGDKSSACDRLLVCQGLLDCPLVWDKFLDDLAEVRIVESRIKFDRDTFAD